jgi:uncharacterized membrane protein
MNSRWDLHTLVGSILMAGVILATGLLIAGLVWQWMSSGTFGSFPSILATNLLGYVIYTLQNATVEGMGPATLVNAGIAILLLTPFVRVFASVLFFGFREENRVYTAITGFVFVVLGIVLLG